MAVKLGSSPGWGAGGGGFGFAAAAAIRLPLGKVCAWRQRMVFARWGRIERNCAPMGNYWIPRVEMSAGCVASEWSDNLSFDVSLLSSERERDLSRRDLPNMPLPRVKT